jgi:hypothetical protein
MVSSSGLARDKVGGVGQSTFPISLLKCDLSSLEQRAYLLFLCLRSDFLYYSGVVSTTHSGLS